MAASAITAAELAALGGQQISGSYKLTADIDMTGQTMQPIKKFSSGTFDGQGHTISGLTIAASSGNTGLFAETGSGAVIQGIVLQDANVSLSSGSYVGVGALVKMAAEKGRSTRPDIKLGICGEHGGDPSSVEFCHNIGLNYVSCSPFRVPIARLAAAQAAIKASK